MIETRILEAMARVPRHEFVPVELTAYAYADQPLPIGYNKTISQPFIVALMTDLLDVPSAGKVLEVGTGLGYHAAVLASLGAQVYTVEIIEELAVQAGKRLKGLGFSNISMKVGNGEYGWPEYAPFDPILVCAASELVPAALLKQLKPGGKMVVPTGVAEAQVRAWSRSRRPGVSTSRKLCRPLRRPGDRELIRHRRGALRHP